ncbi:MAG: UDP-3-O-(3-hydroxymyristoyl)glucosamine N-acyltransferase [Candidatus Omnitrophica bacterium]|nr:UDP-3-O-(3-hydroxymyristoyl)glucosamine N-acyltransferase [Candidatus Omnitrophota bacterium]MCB9719999.1 UDP-3-O-(3-hydroxymyristoyl)glucosamine N-acyltransferase [Candidatus Omnitrophota bacterium]
MITLNELREAEPSFRLRSDVKATETVAMLCSVDGLSDGGIALVKDRKYFDKLVSHIDCRSTIGEIGIIFQEAFYRSFPEVNQWEGLSRLRFYATVASVDVALSRWSALFYHALNHGHIRSVDGRISGLVLISPSAAVAEHVFIGEDVEIDADCRIHAGCVILSGSRVGRGSILYPQVVLYRNVQIGRNCIVHANTTVGSDGFSFNFVDGHHLKVWHFGGVRIGDNVEIGANCSIDQGTLSPTIIGAGTKIDNQVHIAHNCRVGKGVIICGQSGLAGSVTIGDFAVIAGAVNIAPDVRVGHGARIGGMSGVTGNIPDGTDYAGHPARPVKQWLRSQATLRRLAVRSNGSLEEDNSAA